VSAASLAAIASAAAALASIAASAWGLILLLPWQPHRTRERLEAATESADLGDVAVLIPARNEAGHIGRVLRALGRQGPGLEIVVVDDESGDGTAAVCRELAAHLPLTLRVVDGAALPAGWAGKLWALQQGLDRIERRYCLLLDADIELAPHMVPALRERALGTGAVLVSVMATLPCRHAWERLLVPAFIFFFKLLYPFSLVASGRRAGAAGGCMLVETHALRAIGGFAALRNALIDDCTLAARLRARGGRLVLGLSRSAQSLREYPHLGEFWSMVTRTAFTQLRYSTALLLATTLVMLVVFLAPLAALAIGIADGAASARIAGGIGLAGLVLMALAYLPVVRFYRLPVVWSATLPAAGVLFLAMTWASAINYWRGTKARWKERSYEASLE
jgi:hopene-associated glycosyltransferase HpnB